MHSHLPCPDLVLNNSQDQKNTQRCAGMYSRKSWGGAVDPFILVKFLKTKEEGDVDPVVSLVMFEWQDKDLIGKPLSADNPSEVRHQTSSCLTVPC